MRICPKCQHPLDGPGWDCGLCSNYTKVQDGVPVLAPDFDRVNAGFDPKYFEKLAEFEESHFWFECRINLILKALDKYFPEAKSFLEIGCGTGLVSQFIKRHHPDIQVSGSELFIQGLSIAIKRVPEGSFMQMDARAIPFRGHFDLVGAFDVIEHIEEDVKVLSEIHKSLCPKGGLILTVPQHQWLWSQQDDIACHVRRYSSKELVEKVQQAGFEILYKTSFISLLLPVIYIKRKSFGFFQSSDVSSELNINPILNKIFKRLTSVERYLIDKGMKFPIGSSLLMVARKT